MTILTFIYNDVPGETNEQVLIRLPFGVIQNSSIVGIIDMDNTIEIIKDKGGNTGQKFDAKQITLSMPERKLKITHKL